MCRSASGHPLSGWARSAQHVRPAHCGEQGPATSSDVRPGKDRPASGASCRCTVSQAAARLRQTQYCVPFDTTLLVAEVFHCRLPDGTSRPIWVWLQAPMPVARCNGTREPRAGAARELGRARTDGPRLRSNQRQALHSRRTRRLAAGTTCRRSSRPASIPNSVQNTRRSLRQEGLQSSPSPPSCASFSCLPALSSETTEPASQKPLDHNGYSSSKRCSLKGSDHQPNAWPVRQVMRVSALYSRDTMILPRARPEAWQSKA